jgi:transcription-repair coupling factor (superfamily II helicase)
MIKDMEEELLDRFGPLPPEGGNLLEVVRLKYLLRTLGVKRLDMQDGFAVLQFAQPERLDLEQLIRLLKKRPERFRLNPDQSLKVRLPENGPPFLRVENCLKEVATFVKAEWKG